MFSCKRNLQRRYQNAPQLLDEQYCSRFESGTQPNSGNAPDRRVQLVAHAAFTEELAGL
jgi:predicted nucleic acid-binding Zn ribbon protein